MTAESASTRHVPKRSAMAPNIGCPRPQSRFWIAMASPKVVRSQPRSASIGNWKKPIAERGPKLIAAIRQPQMMISQGKLDTRRVGTVEVAIAGFSGGSGDPSDIFGPIKRIGCDVRFNFPDA